MSTMAPSTTTATSSTGSNVTKTLNRNSGGLRILNRPKISAEQEKRLREELHAEIANKTKSCSNVAYECTLSRIDGYDYCIRHILQDPSAPYKQCTFLLSNGKRCLQPAPKYDPKKDILTSFCFEHSRLSQLIKTRTSIGKYKRIDTTESILNDLSHHVNAANAKHLDASGNALRSPYDAATSDGDIKVGKPYVDPFCDINAAAINASGRKILDYASDSSSDVETPTVSNTWRGQDLDNSDNESIDSQSEDLLKHAEVYTTEQVTKITKEKLMRLRSLYIDQLYRLKHILREKRRNYCHSLRAERETLCSIHDQSKDTIRERKLYEKLKALNKYHKRNGIEAILYKKFKEKRQRSNSALHGPPKPAFQTRCIFTEGGVKCGERIIPYSKYCRKHILEDKKQVLFRACDVEKGGIVCQEPVANIFEDATCMLHIQLPSQRSYSLKKYESESEDEPESSELAVDGADDASSALSELLEVKTEPLVGDVGVTEYAASVDNPPPKDVDELKVEEGETNLTFCHDTSSTTIVVFPKPTGEENVQSIATATITGNEMVTMTTNEPEYTMNTSSSSNVVFPEPTSGEDAQSIATTTITGNESNTVTTNDNELIPAANTFQPMEVDDKIHTFVV